MTAPQHKWKDFYTWKVVGTKRLKSGGKTVKKPLTKYSCKYCSHTSNVTSVNASRISSHPMKEHKIQWNAWTEPSDATQGTLDHLRATRSFQKIRFPTTNKEQYQFDVAMRIIKANSAFSNLDKDWYWAPEENTYIDPPKFGSRYFKTKLLKPMYDGTLESIAQEVKYISMDRDRDISIMLDGYDCTVSKTKVVNFIIITRSKSYLYKSYPIQNTVSEDSDLVVGYLKDVIKDFGASKVASVITDNAETMQATWRKLVSSSEVGSTAHILFMSCCCHMLHNYVALVLKSDYFAPAFAMVNSVLKRLRKMKFRQYYRKHRRQVICPSIPSYTKIRWGSASSVVAFVVKYYDIIIEFLMSLKSKKDKLLWKKLAELKALIVSLSGLLDRIVLSIRQLEGHQQWIGDSYYELGKLRWHIAFYFADVPDLLIKYENIWNNSYSDITVLGILLSPYYFNITLNPRNDEHRFLSSVGVNTEDHKSAVAMLRTLAFPGGIRDADWKIKWTAYATHMKKMKFKDFADAQAIWASNEMQEDYPELFRIFQQLSTSRPSTATVERVHTLFTLVMTKLRNRMNPLVLCMLVFLKANDLFGSEIKNFRLADDPNTLTDESEIYGGFAASTLALKEDPEVIAMESDGDEQSEDESSDDELSEDDEEDDSSH